MLKKLFGYSMSTWVGALLAFVIMPLASHIFPKDELGVINYYYSVINIVFTFFQLGLDQAYLRFYSECETEEKRKSVFRLNIAFSILAVLVCMVVCLPFQKRISTWILGTEDFSILPVMLFHLAGLVVSRYYVILYRLQASFWSYTVVSICNTLLLKVAYIAGSVFGATAFNGLYASATVATALAAVIMLKEKDTLYFRLDKPLRSTFQQELRYALPLIPAMLIAILNNNIPSFFIREIQGFAYVAEYTVGVTLASMITLLHNGLNTFLEPFIFKNYDTEQNKISQILEIFTKCAFFVCIGVVVVQDLFFLVFEKGYAAVTEYLPILLASSLWYSIGDFYNIGVKVRKQTKINIPIYGAGILVNIIMGIILVPKFGNFGAAVAAATASFAVSTLKMLLGNRYYPLVKSWNTYVFGTMFLVLVCIVNAALMGSFMRVVAVGAIWAFSGAVLGLYKDGFHYLKLLRQKSK